MEASGEALAAHVRGWSTDHCAYFCSDGTELGVGGFVDVLVEGKVTGGRWETQELELVGWQLAPSGLVCGRVGEAGKFLCLAVVSQIALSRDLVRIIGGTAQVRTVVFPSTVRHATHASF